SGGSFDNTTGGAITTLSYPLFLNGDFSFIGSNSLDFGNGSVSLNGDRTITTPGFNNLRIGGALIAASFSLTKNGPGPLVFDASPITVNSLTINGGTFIATSNTLTIGGNFSVGAATFNNNGGTVSVVGNAAQAVAGVSYQNLSFSGSGIKTASGAINVNTVNNAATFNMSTFVLTATTINNAGGTVQFSGATNGFAIGTGTVEYNGPSQTVGAGSYSNLTINQSSGDATLAGASSVGGVLNLASGNFNLGVNQLTLGTGASTAGASASRFIIATGGGSLRKDFSAAGSFTFPIGDNTGVTEYSPISINFLTGGGPSFITVSVTDSKHPSNNSPTNFLSRFWNVSTGVSGTANITANYPAASINGTQTSISAGQLTGAFNQTSNPWIKFGALGGGTLTANGAALNSGAPSIVTGIEGSNPVANAGTDKSICNSTNVTLGAAPTATGGAGGYTYNWTPATNLSAANVSNPVYTATAVGTNIYTVTVTDANGFVATDAVDVTVNANPAPVISGANTVCLGQAGVAYNTPTNVGRSYAWTISGGTIATGAGTAAITVNWGAAGIGTLQLTETVIATGCNTTTALFNVTINASPTPSVSGLASVCAGQTGVVYTTPNVGGNSYVWSVTGGSITSGAGTNSIVVSWGVSGVGIVSLTETVIATGCVVTTPPYNVTVNPNPAPSIAGSNNVCANQAGAVYSTAAGVGRSYSWTVTGGTIASGAGTNSIQVNWGVAGPGTVQLTETIIASSCSATTPVLNVAINAPPTPSITGLAAVCASQSGVAYSTPVSGNIFFWSVAGGSIAAGAGTNSINVTWGSAGSGTVNLTEISLATGCITNAATYNVLINPQPNPSIAGDNNVCANDSGKVYSVPLVAGNSYGWAVTGGTIIGPSSNNSVVVDWGVAGAGSVQLIQTVTATGCSFTTSPYVVTINALPTPSVAGSNNVCESQAGVIYTTANVGGNSYAWSVAGGLITSGFGTNSITVTWNGAGTGTVSLTETIIATGCATTASPLSVTINPKPTPTIIGNNTACAFDTGKTYTTVLNVGNSYSWAVTGGTIVGPSTGNSVVV
ncbi:MAG: beta strand repeat-containing protein, partial [Flammeovirgaceae bacterium]